MNRLLYNYIIEKIKLIQISQSPYQIARDNTKHNSSDYKQERTLTRVRNNNIRFKNRK